MKKVLFLIICVLCLALAVGCGKSNKADSKTSSKATTSSEAETETETETKTENETKTETETKTKTKNETKTKAKTESTDTYDIKTKVTTLKYAAEWKDKVKTTVTDTKVSFKVDNTPIFDIVFEKCDGYLLGTYKGTPIYIVEYPVEGYEQARMVEDINVILENLLKDKNFVVNKGNNNQ